MKKGILLNSLLIILPLGIIITFLIYIYISWKKIKLIPFIISADLSKLNINDIPILLSGQNVNINANIGLKIINKSSINIPFSNISVSAYYNDVLMASTSDSLKDKKFIASSNNSNDPLIIVDSINVNVNKEFTSLIINKIKGNKAEINYKININIFGIPIFKFVPINLTSEL